MTCSTPQKQMHEKTQHCKQERRSRGNSGARNTRSFAESVSIRARATPAMGKLRSQQRDRRKQVTTGPLALGRHAPGDEERKPNA